MTRHRMITLLITFHVWSTAAWSGGAFAGDVGPGGDKAATDANAPQAIAPVTREPGSGQNVLLITLDTTRVDYLGCYGRKEAVTPTLDALARRGTLFEQAFCQVPITLPSHASILTGLYPRQHGVSDNGRERLSEDHKTLAHLAKANGYRTGAFVASYVLDARFGLAHGFDEYNDDMGARDRSTDPFHWEQPANVVTDRALGWLDQVKASPFFCWVHYYDPHDPYSPPEAFRSVGANPYDGEIAFVDSQIKRVTDWLAGTKLDEHTLIIVVADHGESFGEHREVGHTMFLYDTNIHVPMLIAGPTGVKKGQRVDTVVETVDILPTVIEMLKWSGATELGLMGRSLAPALVGDAMAPGAAYSESLYGLHTYGWCEQRCLATSKWKYVSSVKPELFDRSTDREEKNNLFEAQTDRAGELRASLQTRFEAMPAGASDRVEIDAQSRQKLQSLGYIVGGGLSSEDFLTASYPDPKDEFELVRITSAGSQALRAGDYRVALLHFFNVTLRAPNCVVAQSGLGTALLSLYDEEAAQLNGVGSYEHLDSAIQAFGKTLELDPMNELAKVSLGDVLVRQNKFGEAAAMYQDVLNKRDNYPEVHAKKAIALRHMGRNDQARAAFERALALDPSLADVHYELGVYYLDQKQPDKALAHFHDAVRFDPKQKNYHYNLGIALFRLDSFEGAAEEFKIASELDPNFKDAMINLGIAQYQAGQIGPAQATFMRASEHPLMAPEALFNLGVIMEKEGRPKLATDFYKKAFHIQPDYVPAATQVVNAQLRDGKASAAVAALRKAIEARPGDAAMIIMLAEVLATSKDEAVRSGSEAVTLAERAMSLAGADQPDVLRALALGQAETGSFDKAISTASRGIELARSMGRVPFAERLEAERNFYEKKMAIRSDRY